MWPRYKRKIKLKLKYKNIFNFNLKTNLEKLKNKKNLKYFKIFNFKIIKQKKLKSKFFEKVFNNLNYKTNFFLFKFFFLNLKKKKKLILKKKIFNNTLNNLFNKLFYPNNFKIFLKTHLNNKKLNFLKYFFYNIYKHNFFKIFTFLKKQYFLCFLYTFWYKDITALSFSIWNGFNKIKNGERYILKTFKSFLKSIILTKYGILGIKLILKGKLFKKRRKKIYNFNKGSLNLLTLKKNIKFTNYTVFTRAGTFNFKWWIAFI